MVVVDGTEVVVSVIDVVVLAVPEAPPQAATTRLRVAKPNVVRLIPMRRSNVVVWVTVPQDH